ncbi:uncharacterized protein DS421_3g88720 [Arachis hypogaea]|nr:uncharacterized protein DS421_3g88720 [Arachis hypogaea]
MMEAQGERDEPRVQRERELDASRELCHCPAITVAAGCIAEPRSPGLTSSNGVLASSFHSFEFLEPCCHCMAVTVAVIGIFGCRSHLRPSQLVFNYNLLKNLRYVVAVIIAVAWRSLRLLPLLRINDNKGFIVLKMLRT